ncbi:MAG: Yip1 family protein, partial [Syntrophales bacterium]
MNIVERIKGILLKPKEEWQIIAGETTPIAELYKNYIILLAAIGPVASFIGMSIVGVSLPVGGSYRVSITTGIVSAIVQYVLTLVGVYVL